MSTFPMPSGTFTTSNAASNSGEWHNYFVDAYRSLVKDSGYSFARTPLQGRYLADQLLNIGAINSIEKGYLYQYADLFNNHYDESTDTWQTGTSYHLAFISTLNAIHDGAANDTGVTNDAFKLFSNIAVGSLTYWTDGGTAPVDFAAVALAGIIASDLFGACASFIVADASGQTGAGLFWMTLWGGAVTSTIWSLSKGAIGIL